MCPLSLLKLAAFLRFPLDRAQIPSVERVTPESPYLMPIGERLRIRLVLNVYVQPRRVDVEDDVSGLIVRQDR